MKVEYINPFIESVFDLCTTMLDCKVERGDVSLSKTLANECEIVALIGLSGSARGNVALSFPHQTALAMVSRFMGLKINAIDGTVSDAVAEMVNIVAGGAKARLCDGERPIDLGLPNVIRGKEYTVEYPSSSVWLDIPFTCDLGPFSLRVTFLFNGNS